MRVLLLGGPMDGAITDTGLPLLAPLTVNIMPGTVVAEALGEPVPKKLPFLAYYEPDLRDAKNRRPVLRWKP